MIINTFSFFLWTASIVGHYSLCRKKRHARSSVTIVSHEGNSLSKQYLERCPALYDYDPSTWFFLDACGQLQTFVHAVIRRVGYFIGSQIEYDRMLIRLEDGGTVAVDWVRKVGRSEFVSLSDSAPVVIIQHGLCGNSYSEYVVHVVIALQRKGYRVGVMIARGCGGLNLTTPVPFSASRLTDFRTVISSVRQIYPKAKVFGMGYSLGAAILLNYVGTYHSNTMLDGALSISPPWDFHETTPVFTLWSSVFALALKQYVYQHRHIFGMKLCAKVLFSFDIKGIDTIVAPLHGHADVTEYYDQGSPVRTSRNIVIPTLVINSTDDPIIGFQVLNEARSAHVEGLSSNPPNHPLSGPIIGPGLCVAIVDTGGHLSFAEGLFPVSLNWTDRVAIQWFDSILTRV